MNHKPAHSFDVRAAVKDVGITTISHSVQFAEVLVVGEQSGIETQQI